MMSPGGEKALKYVVSGNALQKRQLYFQHRCADGEEVQKGIPL